MASRVEIYYYMFCFGVPRHSRSRYTNPRVSRLVRRRQQSRSALSGPSATSARNYFKFIEELTNWQIFNKYFIIDIMIRVGHVNYMMTC